ncbi:MAG: uracil phosphoribosyltransferase [Bacteroidota bacterium]
MHYNLCDVDSVANRFLLSMRDIKTQGDRAVFRRNMQRLGSIMAYEISKRLKYKQTAVETPLGTARARVTEQHPVLITILRAGLPFFTGFQELFDQSDAGFIGAYRQEGTGRITIKVDYAATPSIAGKDLVLIDPMLATGRSAIDAINLLSKNAQPSHIHLACMVAAPEGLKYAKESLQSTGIPFTIWSFAVDEKLDERFYIVPGLGDAGDLSFGNRI